MKFTRSKNRKQKAARAATEVAREIYVILIGVITFVIMKSEYTGRNYPAIYLPGSYGPYAKIWLNLNLRPPVARIF